MTGLSDLRNPGTRTWEQASAAFDYAAPPTYNIAADCLSAPPERVALVVLERDGDAVGRALDVAYARVGLEGELRAERAERRLAHDRIGDGAEASSAAEDAHAHAEAVQCLAELEADDARSEHRDGLGERFPREDVVVDDDSIPNGIEHRRNHGRRSGRDDDGPGLEPEIRDRVFEPGASSSGSTGLGLGIARRVASSLGGEVQIDDRSEVGVTTGAAFVVSLPRR